jgi:hypothetical protein
MVEPITQGTKIRTRSGVGFWQTHATPRRKSRHRDCLVQPVGQKVRERVDGKGGFRIKPIVHGQRRDVSNIR